MSVRFREARPPTIRSWTDRATIDLRDSAAPAVRPVEAPTDDGGRDLEARCTRLEHIVAMQLVIMSAFVLLLALALTR